jgi:hypothetical protein
LSNGRLSSLARTFITIKNEDLHILSVTTLAAERGGPIFNEPPCNKLQGIIKLKMGVNLFAGADYRQYDAAGLQFYGG